MRNKDKNQNQQLENCKNILNKLMNELNEVVEAINAEVQCADLLDQINSFVQRLENILITCRTIKARFKECPKYYQFDKKLSPMIAEIEPICKNLITNIKKSVSVTEA